MELQENTGSSLSPCHRSVGGIFYAWSWLIRSADVVIHRRAWRRWCVLTRHDKKQAASCNPAKNSGEIRSLIFRQANAMSSHPLHRP
jgi:hypothetical protein